MIRTISDLNNVLEQKNNALRVVDNMKLLTEDGKKSIRFISDLQWELSFCTDLNDFINDEDITDLLEYNQNLDFAKSIIRFRNRLQKESVSQ